MLNLRFSKSLKAVCAGILGVSLLSAGVKGEPRSWDEVLLELSDLRHELKTAQVDFDILREKLHKGPPTSEKGQEGTKLAALEKKLHALESLTDKLAADVRTLNTSLAQLSKNMTSLQGDLLSQTKLLEEFTSLKGTLDTISKTMTKEPSSVATYQVKAGDSMSLIAKKNKVTLEALRQANPSIKEDKIKIGQELKLPHAAS